MAKQNQSTLIMMLASHMFRDEIEKNVEERLEHPYKQDICADEVDLLAITKELEQSKQKYVLKTVLFFIIALVFIFIAVIDLTTPNSLIELAAFPTFFVIFLIEWLDRLKAKKRIRAILDEIELKQEPHLTSAATETPENSSNDLVIYGGYSPFLGAGIDLDSWSFPINLSEAGGYQ